MKKNIYCHSTNVAHYLHVIQALQYMHCPVKLIRRYEVPYELSRKLDRSYLTPDAAAKLVRRRTAPKLPPNVSVQGLGVSQLLEPLAALMSGFNPPAAARRAALLSASRRVARHSQGATLLHSIEGLAVETVKRRSVEHLIIERRNLHPGVFERDLETYDGFPFRQSLDPVGDILETEYAHADKIIVYSQVAKQSFLEQGFASEKLEVCPLPVSLQLGRRECRKPIKTPPVQLLYVGRVDAFKGIDVASAAVRLLGAGHRLRVAGPATQESVSWLRRQPHVDYLGVLDRESLDHEYANSHLLLLPSEESFGFVAFEAVSQGLHVLVRETTGAREYLPQHRHTTVVGRNPRDWAEAIARTIDVEPPRAEEVICEAVHEENVVSALVTAYSSLMNRNC